MRLFLLISKTACRLRNRDAGGNGRKLQRGGQAEAQKKPGRPGSGPLPRPGSRPVLPVRPAAQQPAHIASVLREADRKGREPDDRRRGVEVPLQGSLGVAWQRGGCHDNLQRSG